MVEARILLLLQLCLSSCKCQNGRMRAPNHLAVPNSQGESYRIYCIRYVCSCSAHFLSPLPVCSVLPAFLKHVLHTFSSKFPFTHTPVTLPAHFFPCKSAPNRPPLKTLLLYEQFQSPRKRVLADSASPTSRGSVTEGEKL